MKINPVSHVAGFAHHQVTADAGAEVKAFDAYAEWCKDQAQDDDHQQETLDTTNAAIENFAAKAESAVREEEAKDFSKSGGISHEHDVDRQLSSQRSRSGKYSVTREGCGRH